MKETNTASASKIGQQGVQVYEHLKPHLEADYPGKFVVIEVESGDYFVGDTVHEATEQAKQKYPDKIFYSVKVGAPGVYTLSSGASIAGPSLRMGMMLNL